MTFRVCFIYPLSRCLNLRGYNPVGLIYRWRHCFFFRLEFCNCLIKVAYISWTRTVAGNKTLMLRIWVWLNSLIYLQTVVYFSPSKNKKNKNKKSGLPHTSECSRNCNDLSRIFYFSLFFLITVGLFFYMPFCHCFAKNWFLSRFSVMLKSQLQKASSSRNHERK